MTHPSEAAEGRSAPEGQLRQGGRSLLLALYTALRSLKLYPLENTTVQKALDDLDSSARALLQTENVRIDFTAEGIAALARIAAEVNAEIENIGARRLQTVMEKLLEDVSFTAEERTGETIRIDSAFVQGQLAGIAKNADLSRYVL